MASARSKPAGLDVSNHNAAKGMAIPRIASVKSSARFLAYIKRRTRIRAYHILSMNYIAYKNSKSLETSRWFAN